MAETPRPAWVTFGAEVRRLRKERGLTTAHAAKAADVSVSMLVKQERGVRAVQRVTAERLDEALAAKGSLMQQWARAVRSDAEPDWYHKDQPAERRASEILMFHPVLVPGLLQIDEYARTVVRAGLPLDSPDTVEGVVKAKRQRRGRLTAPGGPFLRAVVDEVAIRRVMGDEGIMAAQVSHLIDAAGSRAVRLQVLPGDLRAHPALSGGFRILKFTDRPSMAHVEHMSGNTVIADASEIRRLEAVWADLQAWAWSPAESVRVMEKIRDEISP
ncbi:transcriptional regulator with XRE-family HTH domain [Nocardiopsis mwathae]|uniref:Transcriptional regulator with XRE-family HTH domain n=1 Tax=Nocardiopsis mwathae TaxID=1472723 RepID=A0A7W9YKU4_9ACTN|nr:helix-turn-helix transcriptional regulator [Nocardiopsis mwathae]MBB6173864.1 transcriptional regulator with XRE-family HTH domain [Nocardiopsis mwathae]